jgi:mitochondrial fission protein ELM1
MCAALNNPTAGGAPLIWALLGPKAGDNAQVRALAAALVDASGARVEERLLAYHGAELLVHAWPWPSRAGLARGAGALLRAPWPELVISSGRRSEPIAQWIRARAAGKTRLVHLGRPWSPPGVYDLVVSSAQYGLRAGANVMVTALPLTALPAPAAAADAGIFAQLPRPFTAVLAGGDSGFLRFDRDLAVTLADRLERSRRRTGGSLLISGSRRTPAVFFRVLQSTLREPRYLYAWSPEGPNPYPALLAAADVLVVTSDSMSMVVDAVATGKPVYLFEVRPRGRDWLLKPGEYRWRALSHRLVQAFAPARLRRDVRCAQQRLVDAGVVRWLETAALPFQPTPLDLGADLAAVVARVLALLDQQSLKPTAR